MALAEVTAIVILVTVVVVMTAVVKRGSDYIDNCASDTNGHGVGDRSDSSGDGGNGAM